MALALHERNRTGKGQSVDSGLTLTACLLQSPYFLDYQGYRREEPEGLGLRGVSALSRLYAAADGWLYLHCPGEAGWARMTRLNEFAPLAGDSRFFNESDRQQNDRDLSDELERTFSLKNRSEWVDLLQSAGVSAAENVSIEDYRDDPYVRQAGLIVTRDHPGRGLTDHLGPTAVLTGTPMRLGRTTPVLGSETTEILQEIGYAQSDIESLIAARVAIES